MSRHTTRTLALLAALAAPISAEAAAAAETVVITGATIHTMGPQGTIQGGSLVIENGRIKAVGPAVAAPAGARMIDGRGRVVTPGLFDSLSRLGLVEVGQVAGTRDATTQDDHITAAFSVADALNPRSSLIPVNRVEGLTRALVAPNAGAGLIAGQGAIIHLGGPGDFIVRAPLGMFAVFGEAGSEKAGGSRAAALLKLREAFEDAKDYAANRPAFDAGNRRDYALSRLDLAALSGVLQGTTPFVVAVHRASDIEAILRLGKEYNLKLVLAGCAEGWKVASQIAKAKVPVLLSPLENLPGSFETLGATLENAARLNAAGVTIAFMTGEAHNGRNLKQAAGNAVAYGLPWQAGLAAMTVNPARIWGIADTYGTLEPGKDADVVVWDGDPLEVTTFADAVFIKGVQMPMDTRQTKLRDRYKELGGSLPPAYRNP